MSRRQHKRHRRRSPSPEFGSSFLQDSEKEFLPPRGIRPSQRRGIALRNRRRRSAAIAATRRLSDLFREEEDAALAETLVVQPAVPSRPPPLSACQICYDDDNLFSVCSKTGGYICGSCLSIAIKVMAHVDGPTLSTTGMCPIHNLSSCAVITPLASLLDVVPVPSPTRLEFMNRLRLVQHDAMLLRVPSAIFLTCGHCSMSATVAPGPGHSVAPTLLCGNCSMYTTCITCHKTEISSTTTSWKKTVIWKMLSDPPPGHGHCGRFETTAIALQRFRELVPPRTKRFAFPVLDVKPAVLTENELRFVAWCKTKVASLFLSDAPLTFPLVSRSEFDVFNTEMDTSAVIHVLDELFSRGARQQCPVCGRAGIKDGSCTHMHCCIRVDGTKVTWCYMCEQVLTRDHSSCPMYIERGDLSATTEGTLVSSERGVILYHSAKLAVLARRFIAMVGPVKGIYALRRHRHWSAFWIEYGFLVFESDEEKLWARRLKRRIGCC